MDKQRKRHLKKEGAKLVREKSEQLQKISKESNPANIGDSQWIKNYKEINQSQKKYNENRSEVYKKNVGGLDFVALPVEVDLSKEYLPVQAYYLHCKKCDAFVPMNPEISIKCFCNNILFDLEYRRKYIDLVSVEVVKLVAKISPKSNKIMNYFKKLSRIFKRDKFNLNNGNLNSHEVDSINALANKLMKEDRTDELESILEKINPKKLNILEKESWYHLYGICAFQRNDHQDAMTRFSEGLRQLPNCQKIRFSLGQELIFLDQTEKAFLEFDKCSFPEISREYVLRMSNYAYLFDEYQRGMDYISQFFPYYFKLKILDDHFLYVRGLPFFSVCWLNYAGHCILSGRTDKLKELYNKVKGECFDYDFDEMEIELQAHCTRNYESMIELNSKKLDQWGNKIFPKGFLETQNACLISLKLISYEEIINLLNAIKYTEKDHRWLQDVVLLAKANAAHRFNMVNDENQYRKEFMKKQPLLFEIEHAVSFGLLEYQEGLKKLAIAENLRTQNN